MGLSATRALPLATEEIHHSVPLRDHQASADGHDGLPLGKLLGRYVRGSIQLDHVDQVGGRGVSVIGGVQLCNPDIGGKELS